MAVGVRAGRGEREREGEREERGRERRERERERKRDPAIYPRLDRILPNDSGSRPRIPR